MPGGRAVKYAEDSLGVHSVYREAQRLAIDAETCRRNIALHRRAKVAAEESYTDVELAFIADCRADNPDLSQTAFDKFVKAAIHKNPELRKLRSSLAELRFQEETMEAGLRKIQADLDIATARMGELGGYLHYLAELKRAETASTGPSHFYGVPTDWPPDSAVPH